MVGKLTRLADGYFQWIVDDYLSCVWCGDEELISPVIKFAGGYYYLRIHFNRVERNVRLEFNKRIESPLRRLHVKLGMRTGYGGKREIRGGDVDHEGDFVIEMWMACSEMLERRLEILPGGRLTIFCELTALDMDGNTSEPQQQIPSQEISTIDNELESKEEEEEMISKLKNVKKMREDFKSLLSSGEDSDVTIKVKGKEFPAHRNILRSRSPVFKSMFSHDMVEKESGVVVIDDCDPDAFPDFLNYIYTGSTKHISVENVFSLYTSSDKYGVNELKEDCALFMKNNLTVEQFCDTITLAVRHDEKELTELATKFFCDHKMEIIKTPKWETFLHANTKEGNVLLIKALSTS